jgi:AcrR family transcriptional regulator
MSPRTAEQNQSLRDESRAKIVAAALAQFSAHGYDRSSIKQIAAAAGVAQGLIYSHFASKEELLLAIFRQSVHDVRRSFTEAEAGDPARPPVVRIIEAAFSVLRGNLDFWRLSYGVRMQQPVLAALQAELPDWTAAIRERLRAALAEAGTEHPEIEAAILFATIDGVAQHYVLDPQHYPLEQVVASLIQRYKGASDGHSLG